MKQLLITTAIGIGFAATSAYANEPTCPTGTQSCNIAGVFKENTDNSQQVGDHLNNTYAPDSATSDASASVGDVIAQGGASDATATGNSSNNDNRSNANNSLSNQQFGNSHVGDTTSNSNSHVGDTTATSGVSDSGNSTNNLANSQGQGQEQGQQQSSVSHGGEQSQSTSSTARGGDQSQISRSTALGGNQAQQANNAGNRQSTQIDASQRTTIKHAASTAYAPQLNNYGPGNCFGDTNPSGSFTAGFQTLTIGATAGRSKASNVCAIMAVGGQRAAAAYLASMDPAAHRALVAAGVIMTSKQQAEAQTKSIASMPYTTCEVRNGRPYIVAKAGQRDAAVSACMATLQTSANTSTSTSVACPAGSHWDGKGCWMPRR